MVRAATRDVIVVATSYGTTIAIDARSGRELWMFRPASCRRRRDEHQPDRQAQHRLSTQQLDRIRAGSDGAETWTAEMHPSPSRGPRTALLGGRVERRGGLRAEIVHGGVLRTADI